MNKIKHKGKIIKIDNQEISVVITRGDMCHHCAAKAKCQLMQEQTQIIKIKKSNINPIFKIGENVFVTLNTSKGWKALFWIYILPLILFVLITVLGHQNQWTDNEIAFGALSSVIIYFLGLWICRAKIEQKMSFEIEKIENLGVIEKKTFEN